MGQVAESPRGRAEAGLGLCAAPGTCVPDSSVSRTRHKSQMKFPGTGELSAHRVMMAVASALGAWDTALCAAARGRLRGEAAGDKVDCIAQRSRLQPPICREPARASVSLSSQGSGRVGAPWGTAASYAVERCLPGSSAE